MERTTKQRNAMLEAMKQAQRPLTPQELLAYAQKSVPALGIATVYRNLKLLLQEEHIKRVELPGEASRYELSQCAHEHHHHFLCTTCGRAFDIYGCAQDFAVLAPAGFEVCEHEITLYGFCDQCKAKKAAKKHKQHIPHHCS